MAMAGHDMKLFSLKFLPGLRGDKSRTTLQNIAAEKRHEAPTKKKTQCRYLMKAYFDNKQRVSVILFLIYITSTSKSKQASKQASCMGSASEQSKAKRSGREPKFQRKFLVIQTIEVDNDNRIRKAAFVVKRTQTKRASKPARC